MEDFMGETDGIQTKNTKYAEVNQMKIEWHEGAQVEGQPAQEWQLYRPCQELLGSQSGQSRQSKWGGRKSGET